MKWNRSNEPVIFHGLAIFLIVFVGGSFAMQAIEEAKKKERATKCSQNLKQLVLSVIQYEQDREQLPPGRQFINGSGKPGFVTDMVKWSNAVSPYMHASGKASTAMSASPSKNPAPELAAHPPGDADELYPDAYRCPETASWDKAGLNMSYGYNYQYLGNADPRSVISAGTQKGALHYPVARSSIRRPDLTICVADSDGTGYEEYRSAKTNPAGPEISNRGAFAYLLDPTFLPAWGFEKTPVPANPIPPGKENANIGPAAGGLVVSQTGVLTLALGNSMHQAYRSIVSNRHDGDANVGFLDGHVERISREMVYFRSPVPGWALLPSNELWNGFGRDNNETGNGINEEKGNDSVFDENEAYTKQGKNRISTLVRENYVCTPYKSYEEGYLALFLRGDYSNFGGSGFQMDPVFKSTASEHFGPTLPHIPPFRKGTKTEPGK